MTIEINIRWHTKKRRTTIREQFEDILERIIESSFSVRRQPLHAPRSSINYLLDFIAKAKAETTPHREGVTELNWGVLCVSY